MDADNAAQSDLSLNTQAVLLLCSKLGTAKAIEPLTAKEFNLIREWLDEHASEPSILLTGDVLKKFPQGEGFPTLDRLRALINRGRALGLALSTWANFGVWVTSATDRSYPERLRRPRVGPPLLFGVGPMDLLNRGGLAIVGSRDADEEALSLTRNVARRCAEQKVSVISGGAPGVDREALTSAFEGGGVSVAVPAHSLLKAVTEREAREAIRDGRLTVVTPYDPDSGFRVALAMGRNKVIYALADNALVVRFTMGSGGTWAGAVEQLRFNRTADTPVSVFVRVKNNPEEGWHKLRDLGAKPFPEDRYATGKITEIFAAEVDANEGIDPTSTKPEVPTLEPRHHEQDDVPSAAICSLLASPGHAPAEPESCYQRFLSLLLHQLRAEPTKKMLSDIAKRLDLIPQQFNRWLDRAIEEGKVCTKKKGRLTVYVDASLLDRGTLFDRNASS